MIPQVTELIGNYPNPFNPSTTFEYSLAAPAGRVEIAIYNITGQRVSSLIEHSQAVGYYDVSWDATSNTGRPIASGLYFYQLRVDSELISTQRMLLLR
jgi:flagellar hook assembly protein FlgD